MALPTQYPTSWKDKTSMLGNIDLVAIDPTSRDSRAFLTSQSKVLELLRKASAMPGCDFEHDYSRGIYLLIPEQGQIRESVLLLFIDSVVKASDGDSCGAMENVRAIYGLGRHACEPILVSLVTALTYEEVAKRSLELILNQASPHPSVLCENELEGFRPYHDLLRRALKMEEALFGLTTFGLGLTGADQDTERQFVAASIANLYPQESELIGTLVFSAVWRVFFMPYDLSQYRRFMRDAEAALARPLWEAKAQLQEIERSTVKCRERGGIITGLVAPAISRVADRAAEGDANRYLVRLALAAKRYQLKKGNFPAKIDDLVPSFIATIPIDPFDGQPIRMKHDGKDLVFYSIGRDGKDDGGVAKDPGNRDLDLVFRLRGKE